MFPHNHSRNLDRLKAKTYSIKSTVTAQIVTVFFSLLIGAESLYFLAKVFDQLGRSLGVDAEMSFGLLSLTPFTIYLVAIWVALSTQFDWSVPPERLKSSWKYHALGIGLFSGLMTIGIFFTGDVGFILLSVLYQFVQTILLSLIVVTTQRVVLNKWSFDEMHHLWLMSTEGNLWACKAGVVPYREKVSSFWMMIFGLSLALFFGLIVIFTLVFDTIPNADAGDYSVLLITCLPFVGFFAWTSNFYWKSLKVTDIYTVEGKITKSMRPRYYRSPAVYKIHLDGIDFRTEKYLWSEIFEGSRYRLWYTVVGRSKKVIGFEKMSEPQLDDWPVPLAKEETYPRRLSEKPLPSIVKKKHSPQIQQLKKRRQAKRSKSPESH